MANPVIEAIRQSLGRTDQTPLSPRPWILASRTPESSEAEIERFFRELKTLSAVGQRLSAEKVAEQIKSLVAEQKIQRATLWETPFLKQLQVGECLRSLGVELVSPNAEKQLLAQCDLGVTEAEFILPETGTLGLRSSAEKPRAVSLLPPSHLAIVTPQALRPDLHQVFAEAKDSPYLVLITGPSRTSDIELTPTLGMHGPKKLYVWMVVLTTDIAPAGTG
jgi:L-lactate dehydrogenase complex protein LldG